MSTVNDAAQIERVHEFWFGSLDERGLCSEDRDRLWFKKSAETDRRCREQFGEQVEKAIAGGLDHWAVDDRGLIALIVLLDQLPRNVYRQTPRAFAGDERALRLARQAIAAQRHQALPAIHQVMLYLPLEHSEDLQIQRQCGALFDTLYQRNANPRMDGYRRYAIAHREVIEQFGRFPHRNPILGRPSTPAEKAYLASHGGF